MDNSRVIALGPGGTQRWSVSFQELLPGPPVIGPAGQALIATRRTDLSDARARLIALSPGGDVLWQLSDSAAFQVPVVGPQGELYALNESKGYALSSDGVVRSILNLNNPLDAAPHPAGDGSDLAHHE